MSKTWSVTFAIDGCGFAQVVADTEEEAMEKAKSGDFLGDAEIDMWDINTAGYRGGYIEVTEESAD